MGIPATTLQKLRPGLTLRLSLKVREGEKERLQPIEGIILSLHRGATPAEATVTIRRTVEGVDVEHLLPLQSPLITDAKIVREAKVRRARLTYLRKQGKKKRLRERLTTGEGE